MHTKFKKLFFAYPSQPADLISTIDAAAQLIQSSGGSFDLQTWPMTEVFGASIPDEIREAIDEADVLICDITRPNLNVYYEIGYAIGRGKSIAPVLNNSFANASRDIQQDGFFDNIGYRKYENSAELCKIIVDLPTTVLVELYAKPINHSQPLFVLDTYRKTDFRNAIISAIKSTKVFFRNFDPMETPRFSTVSVIAEATASSGIIVPLLGANVDDAVRHNLRAALLVGLGHGLGRQTLILQMGKSDPNNPADYREFIKTVWDEKDITTLVEEFAKTSIVASQSLSAAYKRTKRSALQKLSLGASAAENEFKTLETYFVETAEFLRVMRGEVHIVAGRKGSGKSAIFFRARDVMRDQKNTVMIDLRPDSHQLSLFREELLKTAGVGIFDHSLAAFWYFVILSEIALSIRKQNSYRAKFDGTALHITSEIDELFDKHNIAESGDFTSRINRLGSVITEEIRRLKNNGGTLTPERLTNLIFRNAIVPIRALIEKHTTIRTNIVLLFDNIDKGWPANGVDNFDIRLVRLLMEALEKIQKDFRTSQREFMFVVFLRNDIYELLVEETPDRGKNAQILIDWTDRAKLRQVIFKRLAASLNENDQSFDQLWARFFVPSVCDRDSFEYCVDHCLMRPRFLINIIENAIAHGINRGHKIVQEEDFVDAVRQHSHYLIADFGYEIRDVSGLSAEILYSLIGVTELLTKDEVLLCFQGFGIPAPDLEKAFTLMLWYGVIGVASKDGRGHFIYDYEYSMKRLEAEIRLTGTDILYVVNPALHIAMKVRE